MDLFELPTGQAKFDDSTPLAVRMRPESLTEFVGQEHILGEEGILRKAIDNGVMKFSDKKEFLDSVKKIGKIKYDFDCDLIFDKSKLLKIYGVQKNLQDWFWKTNDYETWVEKTF